MNNKYKLIGFLNMFNIIPDFVFPVFELNGRIFFQEGENDKIQRFSIAKSTIQSKIIPVDMNTITNISTDLFDAFSDPIYAFQNDDQQVVYGNSSFLRQFFETFLPDNEVLALEISDFLDSLPEQKNEIVLCPNPLYQAKILTYYGTGRRKTSIARVYIFQGTGNIKINNINIDNYFGLETLKYVACQPLSLTDNLYNFDVKCTVSGGGVTGQAGAISLGLARALLQYNAELKSTLKSAGLLTRDARMKERKKYGLKAARKAPQFSKR